MIDTIVIRQQCHNCNHGRLRGDGTVLCSKLRPENQAKACPHFDSSVIRRSLEAGGFKVTLV